MTRTLIDTERAARWQVKSKDFFAFIRKIRKCRSGNQVRSRSGSIADALRPDGPVPAPRWMNPP